MKRNIQVFLFDERRPVVALHYDQQGCRETAALLPTDRHGLRRLSFISYASQLYDLVIPDCCGRLFSVAVHAGSNARQCAPDEELGSDMHGKSDSSALLWGVQTLHRLTLRQSMAKRWQRCQSGARPRVTGGCHP